MAVFYLDDGIALNLVGHLQRLGYVAHTADGEGNKGRPDEEHLWFAAQHGWVLVTQNGQDFRMLHRAWHLWGVPLMHAGILVVEQRSAVLSHTTAQDVHELVDRGAVLTNRLFQRRPQGWLPYP